jgi:hypothetical protein
MPAPYSDDLYSAEDLYDDADVVDNHEDDITSHLSPTDGYFRASSTAESSSSLLYVPEGFQNHQPHSTPQPQTGPTSIHQFSEPSSANVPRVPDVLVEDPSIERGSTAESKAREANEERLRNEALNNPRPQSSPSTGVPPSTSAFSAGHSHQRTQSQASSGSSTQRPTSSNHTGSPPQSPTTPRRVPGRSDIFGLPTEAPPAYTPSPTSSTSSPLQSDHPFRNYQTFGDPTIVSAIMGVPDESNRLLGGHQPQSMGDNPHGGDNTTPRWMRGRRMTRATIKKVLWIALLISIITAILTLSFKVQIHHPVSDSSNLPTSF